MRTIIIDDEPFGRDMLKGMLGEFCPELEIVGCAASAEEARHFIMSAAPELVFLDVEMPYEDGFSFLESIHPNMRTFSVVFVTAHNHYSLHALKNNAIDYLLKPVDLDDLMRAVEKVREFRKYRFRDDDIKAQMNLAIKNIRGVDSHAMRLTLPTMNTVYFVTKEKIMYCKTESSYTTFFLSNSESVVVAKPWVQFEELLQSWGFVRIHRSYAVNPEHVERFIRDPDPESNSYVIMSNGEKLEIPRRKKHAVLEAIQKYNLGEDS